MLATLRQRRMNDDAGVTLIELLVVMVIFSTVLAIVGVGITSMFKVTRRESSVTQGMTAARSVNNVLDNSARFANLINTPGTGATGDTYVEWKTGDTTGADTTESCTQWRFDPTAHVLQSRAWTEAATVLITSPTAWLTQARNVYKDGSNPVFATTSVSITVPQQLSIDFLSTTDPVAKSFTNSYTVSATNSVASSLPVAAACNGGGRP
jgi:prepilin-type N-terminal cleavage/methylation domain-containing protein